MIMETSREIFFLFLIISQFFYGQTLELVSSHVLFRHGDRTPLTTFPSDRYKEKDWPNGFGQITPTGIEQHHRLGKYLRQRYESLLNSTYIPNEIFVRSTDFDRTLISAQASLIGLYSSNNLVPIHTVPENEDFLLGINNCPRYDQIQEEISQTDQFERFNAHYREFYRQLESLTDVVNITSRNAWTIADTIFVESLYNRTPSWANDSVQKNLLDIENFLFYFRTSTEESQRIRGGPWVQDVWLNMNRSIHGESFRKVKIYSAHDITISGVLAFLGINYPHQPAYASALFADLYRQTSDSTYFVRIEYLNVTDSNETHLQTLNGCSDSNCPWETFTSLYQHRFPAEAKIECSRKFRLSDFFLR